MAENDDLCQIIKGCKAGKAACFERLIDLYAARCYAYFYRLTGDREVSDDLLSELFVKLVAKIASYRGGPFSSWLFRIAANVFRDYLRQKQRDKKLLDARKKQIVSEAIKPKKSDAERIDELQIQLKELDTDTRELILLRFYSQLSFKELAAMRSEPIGTTLSKVHRGLKKLRELMDG
jgi:RNA polymerase sigma-70 factor (ECF subfamily)